MQMQKGLHIRIMPEKDRLPAKNGQFRREAATGCKCRSSLGDHGIIGKAVSEAVKCGEQHLC